jgi:hypothetical protein
MDDHLTQLYRTDFYLWLQRQAELLQARDFERLDLPNLIEEIEAMGASKRHELEHRLDLLITHLLKFKIQPDHLSRSWIKTIVEQRRRIHRLLKKTPSLHATLDESIADAYQDAVISAAVQTGLAKSAFPASMPFSSQQLLDQDYFP